MYFILFYLFIQYFQRGALLASKAATIQSPRDTIRITIFASRYDTYHDTFLTTLEP